MHPYKGLLDVMHIRDRGRRRDEYELHWLGDHIGTVVVTDEVGHSYPSRSSLDGAVQRAIREVVADPQQKGAFWVTTWFPGLGVT